MKRKAYSGRSTRIVKTSITLPEVLMRFAEEIMADEGFPTLSSYLVHLLHRAKDEEKRQKLLLAKAGLAYPPHDPQFTRIEETARSIERQEGLKVLSSAAKPASAAAGTSSRPGSPPPDDSAAAPAPVPAPPSNPPAASGRSAPKKTRTSSARKPT